jgi:hypothetical protein
MQLNDVSDAHRPFLAEVVPDGAVHDIDVNDSTATYDVWVVHAGWVHQATVTISDPAPGRPKSTRRATTGTQPASRHSSS